MNRIFFLFIIFFLTANLHATVLVKYPAKHLIKLIKGEDDHIKKILAYENKGKGVQVFKYLQDQGYSNTQITQIFLKIAYKKKSLSSHKEMTEFYKYLNDVEGFGPTIRKIAIGQPQQVKGHTQELRLAVSSFKQGGKVLTIGEKMKLPQLKNSTDIDLLIQFKNKKYAIEVKKYNSANVHKNTFQNDFDQIATMAKILDAKPLFAINPVQPRKLIMLREEAEVYGVIVVVGTPNQIMKQIKYLK